VICDVISNTLRPAGDQQRDLEASPAGRELTEQSRDIKALLRTEALARTPKPGRERENMRKEEISEGPARGTGPPDNGKPGRPIEIEHHPRLGDTTGRYSARQWRSSPVNDARDVPAAGA
jgi:hypothetical protein